MDSRVFIARAATAIRSIDDANLLMDLGGNGRDPRDEVQKEVNTLLGSLQNPTLPSAYKLRDKALKNGYYVDPKISNWLSKFEYI